MKFSATPLEGVFVVDLQPYADERGTFARAYAAEEFAEQGLRPVGVHVNLSTNRRAGTLRGLHVQRPPAEEAKLVRCVRGAVFDVAVDLREESSTWHQWFGVELNESGGRALYVPEGCAHGFVTLTDDSTVLYSVSHPYEPLAERGVRFDDPVIAVKWPCDVILISEKDAAWPPLR